ncbi:MAG: CPBP family intramembrane metalloprotease [Deltaproteobacteria bacterium]|nr:CPBP family intramembrane metalloprotease [Deltaproteobacteria bacterium]
MSGTSNPARGAVLLYGLLTVGAVTWVLADRGTIDLWRHPAPLLHIPFALGFVGGLLAGVVFGLIVSRLSRWAVRRTRWAAGLHTEFQALLGRLSDSDILLLAVLSAVAEECFFRGALQPTVGLVAASLVFGGMHVPVNKRFIVWTLEAVVMGFALGGLFWVGGQLAAPMAAHFTINYENLHFVRRYKPA